MVAAIGIKHYKVAYLLFCFYFHYAILNLGNNP